MDTHTVMVNNKNVMINNQEEEVNMIVPNTNEEIMNKQEGCGTVTFTPAELTKFTDDVRMATLELIKEGQGDFTKQIANRYIPTLCNVQRYLKEKAINQQQNNPKKFSHLNRTKRSVRFYNQLPKCNWCERHHIGDCNWEKCKRCNKEGHEASVCWARLKSPFNNKWSGCFKCGKEGHFKKDCPLQTQNGNNTSM
jgi:Zinc knuckle